MNPIRSEICVQFINFVAVQHNFKVWKPIFLTLSLLHLKRKSKYMELYVDNFVVSMWKNVKEIKWLFCFWRFKLHKHFVQMNYIIFCGTVDGMEQQQRSDFWTNDCRQLCLHSVSIIWRGICSESCSMDYFLSSYQGIQGI